MNRVLRALTIAVLALLLGWGGGSVLPAAAAMISDPAEHAELDRAPGWVTLVFDFQVDPSTAKILVTDSSGANVTTGSLIVEWTNVTSQLRGDLPKGTYTVQYRVSRPTGEPMGGSYQFAYGTGDWTPEGKSTWKGADKEPEVMKNPDPNATVTASPAPGEPAPATQSPSPGPQPSESTSVTPTTGSPEPSATESSQAEPAPASGGTIWPVIGVIALVAAAGGAVWYVLRRRRG